MYCETCIEQPTFCYQCTKSYRQLIGVAQAIPESIPDIQAEFCLVNDVYGAPLKVEVLKNEARAWLCQMVADHRTKLQAEYQEMAKMPADRLKKEIKNKIDELIQQTQSQRQQQMAKTNIT